jgi:hypothetical protein
MTRTYLSFFCLVALALTSTACSDSTNGTGTDTGTSGSDTGTGGRDTGVPPTDTGVPPTDTGVPPTDTGTSDVDSGTTGTDAGSDVDANVLLPDGGLMCAAGVECTNYQAALAAAPNGATSIDNCVVQLHQSDCCGAMDANGVNHAARTTLCPAEASCVAMYPTPPGCTDNTITTDTGETTMVMDDVRLRIVDPTPCTFDPTVTCYTCETFVCTTGSCRSAPGIAGGCGP